VCREMRVRMHVACGIMDSTVYLCRRQPLLALAIGPAIRVVIAACFGIDKRRKDGALM